MATARQILGKFGEERVVKDCECPRCKRTKTLVRLPQNFKCADVICDFCGYLAQVKAATVQDVDTVPKAVLGAAWGPQKERMDASVFFPLFLVLVDGRKNYSIFYLSADLQKTDDVPTESAAVCECASCWMAGLHIRSRSGQDFFRPFAVRPEPVRSLGLN